MQGHPDVIDYLNTLLTGELAARDQYFVHSRMYEDWGFTSSTNESITRWKKKPVTPMR